MPIGHLAALGMADLDLNRWETDARPRLQKMTIPLSGTNYRAPRKTKPSPSPEPAVSVQPTAAERSPAASNQQKPSTNEPHPWIPQCQ
jgi:hypothetical protein